MFQFICCSILILFIFNQLTSAIFISNRDKNIKESDQIKALENLSLFQGDILLNSNKVDSNDSKNRTKFYAIPSKSLKWPNAVITFKIDKQFYGKF